MAKIIGIHTPFPSAEAARQALIKLPKEGQINNLAQSSEEQANQGFKKWSIWLLILALVLLGGGIFAYFLSRNQVDDSSKYLQWSKLRRRFSDVNFGIPYICSLPQRQQPPSCWFYVC